MTLRGLKSRSGGEGGGGGEEDYALFLDALAVDFAMFAEAVWPTVNAKPLLMNWHILAIAHMLQRCADGDLKRLIINMPPRHGKSFCVSMAFIAWIFGRDPAARVISIAYGENVALDYARGCKAIMNSALYKEAFPATRISPNRSKDADFETTARGMRVATTVGGPLTGRGGGYLIIDDPIKAADGDSDIIRNNVNDWYDNTLISRLDQPMEDVVIVVLQRVHADDIAGRLITRGGFEVLNLAAIAPTDERIAVGDHKYHHRMEGEALHPERLSLAYLEELRSNNPKVFDAQYQQDPSSSGDAPFKWEDFQRFKPNLRKEPEDYYVISCDTAAKTGSNNDWTVFAIFLVQFSHLAPGNYSLREARFNLVDIFRARLGYGDLVQALVLYDRRYRPRYLLIEDGHLTNAIREGLQSYKIKQPTFIQPRGDKRSRLWAQSNWILQGNVRLAEEARYLEPFKREFEAFPYGVHDDQIDAVSQFLTWITSRLGREFTVQHY